MGRALHLLLSSKLLPMQVRRDNSELSQALTIATKAGKPNGYELLHVVLRKTIPAFDINKVRIEWPQYSKYESVLLYASAIEQTMLLAAKRHQTFTAKSAALEFLDGVIAEATTDFQLQARIIRTALQEVPLNAPLPERFDLHQMAFDIQESKPKEREDPDLASNHQSIYKATQQVSTGTSTDQIQNEQFQANRLNQPEQHMQGYLWERYCVNETIYRQPSNRNRTPRKQPVPDPARQLKKRTSLYDASIVCEACNQRGHPAVRSHALAAALFIQKFIKEKTNEATVQRATENWVQRNAPILKDAQTHEPLKKNPLAVLKSYMDRTGMSMDQINEEVDWKSFDDGGKVHEVFSINGTPWGETMEAMESK
jgi:hypothetical protein